MVTAVATGLVFAKFARSTARVAFTRCATVGPVDGIPHLMLRIGNERGNQIVEAAIRVVLTRTERTHEGVTFYRSYDLPLVREHASLLSRSWTVMHAITGSSPLLGRGPDQLAADEAELIITVVGLDDVSGQTVHAAHRYLDRDIVWGARPADVLSETPDGDMLLDLRRFHDVVPTEPTAGFPYPRAG
jgi:inward rectifier potassium channel